MMVNREKKIIRVSLVGIIANVFLVGSKTAVGLVAGSVAIVLDAVNNLTDVLSSVITIIGTKLASRQHDKEHPFGHGRYEYLSALLIGVIVLAAGIMAFCESVPKIFQPELANYSLASVIIIASAVLVKLFLGRYVKQMGRKLDSGSLIASGVDALWDAALSFATLVGIFTAIWFKLSIDGYLGVLIAVFIIRSSLEILSDALEDILGGTISSDTANEVKEQILGFPEVKGVYDLMVHNYGPNDQIGSVHIEVSDTLTAKTIHKLTREIAQRIYANFGIILTVGIYAENCSDESHQTVRSDLDEIIQATPEVTSMHGFYIDDELKLMYFDLVIPYQYCQKRSIKSNIIKKMKQRYPSYKYIVTLDLDLEN